VNLDGELVGINISRAGRIESCALTPALVLPVLEAMKEGQYPPAGLPPPPHPGSGGEFRPRIAFPRGRGYH